MNICEKHKEVERQVVEFTENVRHVGEESLTDYLFWKWADINKCFQHLDFKHYTKPQESQTSGADFRMEIWLVGEIQSLPLLFQAKKISKEHKSYVSAINYPDQSKGQITKLLDHANITKKVPLYIFYSASSTGKVNVFSHKLFKDCGVFIAHAKNVNKLAPQKPYTKLSKTTLLSNCIHFHELFCYPNDEIDKNSDFINLIVNRLSDLVGNTEDIKSFLVPSDSLPEHVQKLLSNSSNAKDEDYRDVEKTYIKNRDSVEAYIESIGNTDDSISDNNYSKSSNHNLMSTNIAVYDLRL